MAMAVAPWQVAQGARAGETPPQLVPVAQVQGAMATVRATAGWQVAGRAATVTTAAVTQLGPEAMDWVQRAVVMAMAAAPWRAAQAVTGMEALLGQEVTAGARVVTVMVLVAW